jgi:hypothetical protein
MTLEDDVRQLQRDVGDLLGALEVLVSEGGGTFTGLKVRFPVSSDFADRPAIRGRNEADGVTVACKWL